MDTQRTRDNVEEMGVPTFLTEEERTFWAAADGSNVSGGGGIVIAPQTLAMFLRTVAALRALVAAKDKALRLAAPCPDCGGPLGGNIAQALGLGEADMLERMEEP